MSGTPWSGCVFDLVGCLVTGLEQIRGCPEGAIAGNDSRVEPSSAFSGLEGPQNARPEKCQFYWEK